MTNTAALFYLAAAVCFILALRGLSSPETARQGNLFGMAGMALAVFTTLGLPVVEDSAAIFFGILVGGAVGAVIALRIPMTAMPQLVAAFHSLVGMAAVLIAAAAFLSPDAYGISVGGTIGAASLVEMGLGSIIGAITFSGSVVAFAKLQGLMKSKPLRFPGQHKLNAILLALLIILMFSFGAHASGSDFFWMTLIAFALGYLLIVPIGGADMPVVVSMLNSYSGWAAAGIGFTLGNPLLIITGALVGASGAILSYIMCKAMNRSLVNVIFGGFGEEESGAAAGASGDDDRQARAGSPEDAAFMMKNARSVIIVPGYGMAVAQAQHVLREMAEALEAEGVNVRYAIHPVAGRMPGHMNVLLAEANVPYDQVFELEDINRDFKETDIALVIGANDVTNPAAKSDPDSPIYGMPVLNVGEAGTVFFIKRSMSPGYAGVQNSLFFQDNTYMLFGDAKKVVEGVVKALD